MNSVTDRDQKVEPQTGAFPPGDERYGTVFAEIRDDQISNFNRSSERESLLGLRSSKANFLTDSTDSMVCGSWGRMMRIVVFFAAFACLISAQEHEGEHPGIELGTHEATPPQPDPTCDQGLTVTATAAALIAYAGVGDLDKVTCANAPCFFAGMKTEIS